jgi:hypothetical protein
MRRKASDFWQREQDLIPGLPDPSNPDDFLVVIMAAGNRGKPALSHCVNAEHGAKPLVSVTIDGG